MNRTLHIGLITDSFLPLVGGREFIVHNLAIALQDLGHEVTVFVPYLKQREKDNYPYRIVQFGFRGAGQLKLMKPCMYIMLLYMIYRYRIDVINVHGLHPKKKIIPFLKFFTKLPIIGTPHGDDIQIFPDLNYGVRLNPKNDLIVRRAVKNCNRVTAISRSIREHLEEILDDYTVIDDIPNGVWTSTFSSNVNRNETRKRYNIPVNAVLLISVGRNHPKKGFSVGIEALSQLKKKHGQIVYLIIGKNMGSIRQKAKELGVSEILFTPGLLKEKEVAELFQASDIYISPSLIESFGITTIEAMSAGLPCVVSNIEGTRDIVTAKFGILTKSGDSKELADAVLMLLEDPSLMTVMGQEARKESQKYDWSEIADRYTQVYAKSMEDVK